MLTSIADPKTRSVADIGSIWPDDFPGAVKGYIIQRINVPAGHRGRGIGSVLLHRIIEAADAEGATLYLSVIPSGPLGYEELTAWYGRNGFLPHPEVGMWRPPK